MEKRDAEKRAAQIAADIEGPVGRVPLERVFSAHIGFFNELRSLGATWPQIAELLGRAGITKKDGGPVHASQVRATVSRILAHDSEGRPARTNLPKPATKIRSVPMPKKDPAPCSDISPFSKDRVAKDGSEIRARMRRASRARRLEEC